MRYCEILWTISPARGEWFNVVNVVAASMELQIDILPTYEAIPVLGFVQSIDERLSILIGKTIQVQGCHNKPF